MNNYQFIFYTFVILFIGFAMGYYAWNRERYMIEIFLLPVIILKYLIAIGFWGLMGYFIYDAIANLINIIKNRGP